MHIENTSFPTKIIWLSIQVYILLRHVVLWVKALVCIIGPSYL